ncbi:hypothetical protein A2U01_0073790, partial [Trifolium medium]|nr:hypothetical protein [Trifolium medium]
MEKVEKSAKFDSAWGVRSQPQHAVLLFAVCFLRNARAGLRTAQ